MLHTACNRPGYFLKNKYMLIKYVVKKENNHPSKTLRGAKAQVGTTEAQEDSSYVLLRYNVGHISGQRPKL